MYADYRYYRDHCFGTMTEPEFRRYIITATAFLDEVTFDRIPRDWKRDRRLAEKVKLACCAVADICREAETGELASKTVGPWSETYKGSGKTARQKMLEAATLHLGNTGLLYRGL